ncbi:MAG: hypothetical protein OXG82_16690 [Gammaproteobacteria bacterium]|nr:hypothetical protein [Gammaproteobacteria bacterium]
MSATARTGTIKMTRPPGLGVVGSGPLLHLDVLGVEEDGRWSAIALDMSIADHGETFDEALESLRDALKAQFEFAFSKEGGAQLRSNLFTPAEGRYFRMYRDARRKEMLDAIAALHALLVEEAGESRLLAPPEDSGVRRLERRFQCPLAAAER